jgi:hypothetical protein
MTVTAMVVSIEPDMQVNSRQQPIIVETARHRISGTLTLPVGGYRHRMSDFLNASDRTFISLTDATIELLDGGVAPTHQSFVVVSRAHVVLAMPIDGQGDDGNPDIAA